MNRKNVETEVDSLLHDKGWKGPLLIGITALVLFALLGSAVFELIRGLVELLLFVGGFILIGIAAYRAYEQHQST